MQYHSLTVQFLVLIKTNKRADTRGGFNFIQLNFINQTCTAGGLLSFRGVRREATDKGLQLSNLCFLLGVITEQTITHLCRCSHIFVIVAWEQTNFAVIQVSHMRTYTV